MLEGLRIMCLFTFYIVGYFAGIAVKSYYSHNRRHVKVLYHMKDSCTMCTACMSGYIVKRQNGNVSVSYHFICKRFLYTFVSARGGWVWLAGGGARKLRHSLTTMVRYLKIRSFITPQIRVLLKLVLCQRSKLSVYRWHHLIERKYIAAPSLSSGLKYHPGTMWLSLTCHCQCQSSF